MESIFRSLCEKKIINTGFLKGPFCPIYGIGTIIIYVFLNPFKDNILLLFFMGVVILTIWEYLVGVLLEKIFHTKYWDYSDHKINFQGRVCLSNSICWGFLCVAFVKFIHPFVVQKLQYVDIVYLKTMIYIVFALMCIDTITTVVKILNLNKALETIEKINTQLKEKLEEFKELSKDKAKADVTENIQNVIHKLETKKDHMFRKMYVSVYRLKKAFPAINTKEITEILNKRKDFIKKDKNER